MENWRYVLRGQESRHGPQKEQIGGYCRQKRDSRASVSKTKANIYNMKTLAIAHYKVTNKGVVVTHVKHFCSAVYGMDDIYLTAAFDIYRPDQTTTHRS